jgi:intein/homing endonuclease
MHGRKHSLNEKFFDRWSPKMAYVLGFWFADGNMRHEKSYRVRFASKDHHLLLQIRKCMSSEHQIYKRKDGSGYELNIFSKRLFNRLLALGGIQRKSKKVKFPYIPNRYLPDFVRGYFDGDGSVFYTTYIHTKTKRPRTELRSNFTSGNSKILEGLQNILVNTLGFIRKKICPFNKGASWKLGYGTYDTIKLLKFMYYPNYPVGLERKALFAKRI